MIRILEKTCNGGNGDWLAGSEAVAACASASIHRMAKARVPALIAALAFAWCHGANGAGDDSPTELAGTSRLAWEEADLSERMMDGAHRFIERKIAGSVARRQQYWSYDFRSRQAYRESVEPNRKRFCEIIGCVDVRLPARMERFGDDLNPALVAETAGYQVFQVRWPVLEGMSAEGLLVCPRQPPVGCVIAIPDADWTPEQIMGLAPGVNDDSQFARRLAENGFAVVIPTLVDRKRMETKDPQLKRSDQTHREWIFRQAFHMGRHVLGYEVQQVMAAVDWFSNQGRETGVGVVGYGEGGLIAFYAAAVDPRIDVALVSGYFDSRQEVWAEPIYRNVWGLLSEFGDAEIASLVAPRRLLVEPSRPPEVSNQKGEIRVLALKRATREINRTPHGGAITGPELIVGQDEQSVEPGGAGALRRFAELLGVESTMSLSGVLPVERRRSYQPELRQGRMWRQMEGHVQGLVRESEHVRDQAFLYSVMPQLAERKWSTERELPTRSLAEFTRGAASFRERFHREAMGRFDETRLPPNAHTRRILETPKWTAYDVVLDVYPDLFAWGVLLEPKGMKPGERRPVVVCQHGRNGVPRDTIDGHKTAYNDFAARLAEQGFVTFAPHNLYRGEDRYRWLDRKANSVRATLFSFIIAQHEQLTGWLASLPLVDGDRIAFYGLSYGGETAVRVPAVVERYCLSICSGDFNQWTRKVAATDQPFSFMRTIEWEMPYWNLGQTFDYAEMTYLILPRPFMVERGHLDTVGRDRWVAHEYAKTRWLYAQLGIEDRTEIELFQGGHSINAKGTFAFLRKHLKME